MMRHNRRDIYFAIVSARRQQFRMTKRRADAYVALPQTMPFTPSYQYTDTLCVRQKKGEMKKRSILGINYKSAHSTTSSAHMTRMSVDGRILGILLVICNMGIGCEEGHTR